MKLQPNCSVLLLNYRNVTKNELEKMASSTEIKQMEGEVVTKIDQNMHYANGQS